MAKNVKIERIEQAEVEIERMTAEEAQMRSLYMRDGVIDDTEQVALDRVKGKIDQLRSAVARTRAEVEENRRIWNSHAAGWSEVQTRVEALKTFRHLGTAPFLPAVAEIAQAVPDQRWADATAGLEQAQLNLEPVWIDYEIQIAARDDYEPLRIDFDTRLAAAGVAEPQTEAISVPLATFQTKVASIDGAVATPDYVSALDQIRVAISELEVVETEITRVQAAKTAYDDALAQLQPRLMDTSVSEYETLANEQTVLMGLQSEMEALATTHDYEGALGKLQDLSGAVDSFIVARDALDASRTAYEARLTALSGRLAAAASCQLETGAPLQQNIITAEEAMKASAEAESYDEALTLSNDVDAALVVYEALIADRDLYLARLAAMSEELAEASTSRPEWGYLEPIQAGLPALQAEMEAAAEAEDFDTALSKIASLEAKVAEVFAAIEAKRCEYEAARNLLQSREAHLAECGYGLTAETTAVQNAFKDIDKAVAAEDWDGALNGIATAEAALVAFDAAHKVKDDAIRAEVTLKLTAIKVVIAANAFSSSSTKKALIRMVAEMEASLAGTKDLDALPDKIKLAEDMSKELATINSIISRIDDKWDINKDNEARKIVGELTPAEIAALPMEARNILVEQLMDGSRSDGDHDAIQKIWKTPAIDKKFAEFDGKARDSIVDAYKNDPEVQKIAADWGSMNEADKKDAIKKLCKIPCGEDGWDVGDIENYKFKDEAFTADKKSYGSYNHEKNRMMVNTHDHAHGNFTELLDTIAHEVGHRYQGKLIERYESGDLKPGDVEYDQAKALKLCEDYRRSDYKEFKKVYSSSPEEAHSREMGSDIQKGLKGTYGPGGSTYSPGGGGGGGSGSGGSKYDHDHEHEHEHDHET